MNSIEWKYVKKNISSEDVVKFEELTGISFPDGIRRFIMEHNNGRPTKNEFDTVISKGRVFDKLLSFNENDKENVFNVYQYLSKEIPVNLVAIAVDPFGNFICLDKQDNFCVVFWQHETSLIEKTEKDFIEFIYNLK